MGRQFEPGRAVEITSPKYGSGYRIGGRLVLTAAHLLTGVGTDCLVRAKQSFGEVDTKVVWKAQGWDIALIELPESVPVCEPAVLGRLPEGKAGEKLEFQMYGWPRWGRTERDAGKTASGGRQIEGIIYLADRSPDGLLVLEAQRLPPEATIERSEWEGASGAVIVCDGLVVAVQMQHQNPKRPASLEASPLTKIYSDPQWCRLLTLHGINPEPTFVSTTPALNSRLQSRSLDEQRLLDGVSEQVHSLLRQSLHNAIFIHLHKQDMPDQVDHPWQAEIKIGSKPAELISAATRMLDIFSRPDINGKLLILGAPGSGKTTTVIDLAKELLERSHRDSRCPIPIFLSLSSWREDRRGIRNWFVREMRRKYGVSTKLGKELLKRRQLLPLLDGLDEVEPSQQRQCVGHINQWLESEDRPLGLVVCSRSQEYCNLSRNLKLNGCINLHPLTNEQIQTYLTQVNRVDLWSALSQDGDLLALMRTPLWLSIAVLSYSGFSAEQWQPLHTVGERLRYLLDLFIQQMLNRKFSSPQKAIYSLPQTLHWLSWLAGQMNERSQDEFLIEQMQPYLLPTRTQRWLYRISVGVLFGLLDGLLFMLITTPHVGLVVGIIIGAIVTIADRPISTYRATDISTIETFRFSLSTKVIQEIEIHLKQNLIVSFAIGLIVGFIFGALKKDLVSGLAIGLVGSIIFGVVGGVIFGLIAGLRADVETRISPNQGIWASARNIPILTIMIYPAGVLLDMAFFLVDGTPIHWKMSLLRGVVWAFIFALGTSGKACAQHIILRLLLFYNGVIPWNYAQFLDQCTERLFLQRIGGSYRFVHRLLREHLVTNSRSFF